MKFCTDKQCERSSQLLNADQFYEKSDSVDKLDPYCNRCRSRRGRDWYAKKISGQFRRNRSTVQRVQEPTRSGFAFSLVYEAINKGCTTRESIRRETKLDWDSIGDALTELVFDCKAIRIQDREFRLVA